MLEVIVYRVIFSTTDKRVRMSFVAGYAVSPLRFFVSNAWPHHISLLSAKRSDSSACHRRLSTTAGGRQARNSQTVAHRYSPWVLVVSSNLKISSLARTYQHCLRCSLINHGVDHEVNAVFNVGTETLALPLSQKMKFEQGDNGDSFGCATGCVLNHCF